MFFYRVVIAIYYGVVLFLCFTAKSGAQVLPVPLRPVADADHLFNLGVKLKKANKIDRSKSYLFQAYTQYIKAKNYHAAVLCSYYLGEMEDLGGNAVSALRYFRDADSIIQKYRLEHKLRGDILVMQGTMCFKQNKFQQSYSIFEKCLRAPNMPKMADSTFAKLYYRKGTIELYKGDYPLAIESYQKAESFGVKAWGRYSLFVSDQTNNLGVVALMMERNDEALAYFQKSEEIMRLGRISSPRLGGTYSNIGLVFKKMNDFESALHFYNKALELALPDPKNNPSSLASTYINIASVYRALNNRPKEFGNLQLAHSHSQQYYPVLLPKVYQQLAIYYTNVGNHTQSEFYYRLAIKKARELFDESPEIVYYYINYGQFQAERKDYKKSIEAFKKALPLSIRVFGERHITTASCFLNISNHFFDKKRYQESLGYLHKAIIANCKDFDHPDWSSSPGIDQTLSKELMVELLKQKAFILEVIAKNGLASTEKVKYLETAWQNYQLALSLIDKIRIGYLNEESRMFLSGNEQGTYLQATGCALQLYQATQKKDYLDHAFIIADNAHASALQSTIKEKGLPKSYEQKDTALIQENNLKKELSFYQGLLLIEEQASKLPDSAKVKLWSGKIMALTIRLERLLAALKVIQPVWYQYKYRDNSGLISRLKAKLTADEAIVEYFYSDSLLYSYFLTNRDVKYCIQPLPKQFNSLIDLFCTFVNQPKVYMADSGLYGNYRYAGWELYKLLLKPFEAEATGKALIIVPYERLAYVPFEALLTREAVIGNCSFKNLPYLIRQHAVRYLYASNLLTLKGPLSAKDGMAAFAPTYPANAKTELVARNDLSGALESLDETTGEVKTISGYFPGKIYIANEASEGNFKRNAYRYGTLHLAMHAIVEDNAPMQSRLVFTPNSSSSDDDLLYAYEIPNLHLNADLVVLSACNSGIGKFRKGEGLMSLTRSFAFAGVSSIVMTLWSVNGNSSSDLVKKFYCSMAEGKTKEVAIQEAKLSYLDEADIVHAHPYYWAGYVLIGDNAPLKKGTSWVAMAVGSVLAAALLVLVWAFRRKLFGRFRGWLP